MDWLDESSIVLKWNTVSEQEQGVFFYFFSMRFKEGESAVFCTNLTLDCTRMLISFNHSMCLQSLNRAKEGSYDCSVRH